MYAIRSYYVKRFAAENDHEKIWKKNHKIKPASGKKAAIIGAGPCGMTAAYYLALSGHEVTVFERQPEAGGMLSYGIPEYRITSYNVCYTKLLRTLQGARPPTANRSQAKCKQSVACK